jgi:hypothetical protein
MACGFTTPTFAYFPAAREVKGLLPQDFGMSPAIGVNSAVSRESVEIVPEDWTGLVEHSSNLAHSLKEEDT